MVISENALELLRMLHEEKVSIRVVEKRTKWVKSSFKIATEELLKEGLVSEEGVITVAGKEKLNQNVKQKEFSVNINEFNAKWG